ncbi:hypothetical protein [uncultured Mitsuokella sp.]|uniref:hypothetical protein n=1 Tax=uncultured Mitsuokella sp. TaxID=453120 RepID=UPI0025F2CDFB|nr:hypothetical protein [uncultured Mitsuokella sp.]
MINDREKKVLCFGIAIGILVGVIAMKLVSVSGAVILAALVFVVPLIPELRARIRTTQLPQTPKPQMPHMEMPHVEMPHVEVPHVNVPHVDLHKIEMPEVNLESDWLSNKAIIIYFILFIISFVIGYVVLN